jgi:hypothetical protein
MARAVAASHLAVSAFIVFGGLLVARGIVPIWLHLPLALWGGMVHLTHLTCPLTPLENRLRIRAGDATYGHGFVTQYLVPAPLRRHATRRAHRVLGATILIVNAVIYAVAV